VITERKINNKPGNTIENGITIINDGEQMRTLGA
jgi:hypothetical protein